MTYRQLIAKLSGITTINLDTTVTVYDSAENEFHPVQDLNYAGEENDVLDRDHPYLVIKS